MNEQSEERITLHRGDLVLFKRGNYRNGVWHYKLRKPDSTYDQKTTRCKELEEAKEVAEAAWQRINWRYENGLSITGYTFEQAAADFCAHIRRTHENEGKTKTAGLDRATDLVERHMVPYFKGKLLADITTMDLDAYHIWYRDCFVAREHRVVIRTMTSTGRRYDTPKRIVMSNKNYIGPKAEAIRYAITVFRRIFALAVQHRHIAATEMPTFITKKLKLQRRGAFTRNELADLFWHLHGLRANDADRLLASYARLLLWTGIRPGVEASLRFEDILAVPERRDRKGRVVKQAVVHVFVRDGKTGPRTVVAPLKLLRVIDALKAHHPNPVPNALIWTKPNGIEVVSFMARFAGILETLSLTTDLDGRQRSLYSMRHTHITRCIERQVPISWIAKNCGNSIMIIERNYDHVKHTEQSDVVYK